MWRDGKKNIRHVIDEARKLFRCVCMTTNGTISWGSLELDRVWVSLEGPRRVHDEIRGQGVYEKVWREPGAGRQGLNSREHHYQHR